MGRADLRHIVAVSRFPDPDANFLLTGDQRRGQRGGAFGRLPRTHPGHCCHRLEPDTDEHIPKPALGQSHPRRGDCHGGAGAGLGGSLRDKINVVHPHGGALIDAPGKWLNHF